MNPTDQIQSREEFVAFVRRLADDFQMNKVDWENNNVTTYLEALAAWTEDMEGYYDNRGEPVPADINWKFMAHLLIAAKYYE